MGYLPKISMAPFKNPVGFTNPFKHSSNYHCTNHTVKSQAQRRPVHQPVQQHVGAITVYSCNNFVVRLQ